MLTVFSELKAQERQLRALEMKMSDSTVIDNETEYEKVLKEYDHLQIQFKEQGGYQFEADIRSVLHGLKFPFI